MIIIISITIENIKLWITFFLSFFFLLLLLLFLLFIIWRYNFFGFKWKNKTTKKNSLSLSVCVYRLYVLWCIFDGGDLLNFFSGYYYYYIFTIITFFIFLPLLLPLYFSLSYIYLTLKANNVYISYHIILGWFRERYIYI